MAQQVQVFHNPTQVFNQIPTLTLPEGFYLFSSGDLNKWWDGNEQDFKLLFAYSYYLAFLLCLNVSCTG